MELKNFFAQDLQGNVISEPTVYLYQPGTTTLATGLQDKDGNALANPFTGSANGQVVLAAPDGDYDLRVTGAGRDTTMRVRFLDAVTYSAEILRNALASYGGASMLGYDAGDPQTVEHVLDNAKAMANYTALRNYTGRATGVRITQTGLAGFFQRDDADTTSADNGGTIIVDASGRRWKRLFDGAVNVKWFGAVGDGVTDDKAAIQLALNTGKSVYFPQCSYIITSGLTITANYQTLCGDGPLSKIICNTGSTDNGVNMITALGKTGCVVERLFLQNSGYGKTMPASGVFTGMGVGVAFINCHACKVLNNYVYKCGSAGQGVTGIYFSSSTECLAEGNHVFEGQNGINSDSWYYAVDSTTRSRNNCIVGNVIYNCQGSPIVVDTNASLANEVGDTITGNICYQNKYGIGVSGSKVTVSSNVINMNNYSLGGVGFDAIYATGSLMTISNNIILNAYKAGIMLQANVAGYPVGGFDMRDTVISGNVITWDSGIAAGGTDSHGIRIVNNSSANSVEGIIVSNNKIVRARKCGIFLDGASSTVNDITITGNQIESAGEEGLYATGVYTHTLTISGNSIKTSTLDGIRVVNSPRALISNNRVFNNGHHGISMSSSIRSIVSGNIVADNGTSAANTYDAIYCTAVCSASSIYGNQVGNVTTSNSRYGINLDDSTASSYIVFGNQYGFLATGNFSTTMTNNYTRTIEGESGHREIWANGAPVSGTWNSGDRVWSTVPSASGNIGWVCVTSGTPGTWKTFGAISA